MIARTQLRARQLRTVGHGQRYLVEREWLRDGRVLQRINSGMPDVEGEWKDIGRWSDLDAERAALTTQGWEIDAD